jgi:hypothetical protein
MRKEACPNNAAMFIAGVRVCRECASRVYTISLQARMAGTHGEISRRVTTEIFPGIADGPRHVGDTSKNRGEGRKKERGPRSSKGGIKRPSGGWR